MLKMHYFSNKFIFKNRQARGAFLY